MATPFSIIIPTWNNLPFLKLCVESIRKNSAARHQIIVHVNEGIDGTLDWVRGEGLDYTWSERNIGVCLACNMMRTKVKTDYIFYLNDDMYLLPGWDTALGAELLSLPDNRFFLSGSMIQPHHTVEGGLVADYGDSVETFDEERLLHDNEGLVMNDWHGATWPPNLIHRDVWDMIGGYSIEYSPGMGSDPDLTAKLWRVGVRYMKGVGGCRAYHFETKSTGRVTRNDGRTQFLMKWGVTNSVLRKQLTHLGSPWTLQEESSVSDGVRRVGRIKAIWALLTGKQFGPINPLNK